MWTYGIVLKIFLSVAFASELEFFGHNGWIPVSSDIVFNQIRHGFNQAPRYTKADVEILNTDLVSFVSKHEEYKEVLPDKEVDKCNGEIACISDVVQNESSLPFKYNFLPITLPQEKEPADKAVRRSKQVADIDTNEPVQRLFHKHDKTVFKNTLTQDDRGQILEDNFNENKSHAYEVTEKSTIEDKINQEGKLSHKTGYEYNPPDKQDFTNGFIKYISKYVEDSDNLRNYALSRRQKDDNVKKYISHKPFIFKSPNRYNSLNHVSVDPLLAVFLSNFGYYLQGQYGIQNNYKNLYGYLASNNIHNNRPFGFYKLFSDTDSSQ